jgi:AbiV family abortive infection protein
MGSPDLPRLTPTLLCAYSDAALRNADDLLAEASLLRDHNHMARAYFLAVACIEEAGKALLAFDAQSRNLSDPAVCAKLKTSMENHGMKINYALSMWAFSSPNQRQSLNVALDLIGHLRRGREPSMYSDLRVDPDRVQMPREVVRESAARDCISLAEKCLSYSHRHLIEKTPTTSTTAQDRLFTMKTNKFQSLMNTEDFWWYYIKRMEAGQQDFAEAVLGYERDHIKTGKPFLPNRK